MAEQEPNPFEVQPPPQQQKFAWGGMPTITPQEGQVANEGGSFFQLSPEVAQMMWAPPQPSLVPQQQQKPPPPPPQVNPQM
jgi:hypothetical protein